MRYALLTSILLIAFAIMSDTGRLALEITTSFAISIALAMSLISGYGNRNSSDGPAGDQEDGAD